MVRTSIKEWLQRQHLLPPWNSRLASAIGLTVSAFCAIVVVGAYFLVRVRQSSLPGPRLEKPVICAFDLGEGKPGEILTSTFKLRNIGSEPLTFRIEASCACAQLNPREGRIIPGEIQEVLTGIRLRHEGNDEHVVLRVLTDDRENSSVEYRFFARCPAPFHVLPRTIDFGHVADGSLPSLTLKVFDSREKPLSATTSLRLESSSPYLSIEQEKDTQGDLVLHAKLQGKPPHAHFSGEFIITLVEMNKTLTIPVAAFVAEPVMVAPRSPQLRFADHQSKQIIPIDFIVWRTDDKLLGKLVASVMPAGQNLVLEELSQSGEKRRRFRVRGHLEHSANGSQEINLRFEEYSKDVKVIINSPFSEKGIAQMEKEE
jgi:hypothetical protein